MQSYRELFSKSDSIYGTSMLRDTERGGPIEADHIVGFMVEKAKAAGADDTLYRIAVSLCEHPQQAGLLTLDGIAQADGIGLVDDGGEHEVIVKLSAQPVGAATPEPGRVDE